MVHGQPIRSMFRAVALCTVTLGGVSAAWGGAPAVRPDGAVRLIAAEAPASDQNPAFSPDGTRIVFTEFANGYNMGPGSLRVLDLGSGRITRLTPVEDQDNVNLPGSAA